MRCTPPWFPAPGPHPGGAHAATRRAPPRCGLCATASTATATRITAPVKGATLIGNGPDALTKVEMVGDDSALDPGIGTCGKNGQGVPVGVGQPTLKISGLTVGGTAA